MDATPPCDTVEVEYRLSANLELADTPMGQGDGVYHIGPGRAVVRFDHGNAMLISYEMNERFRIDSKTLFWSTHVITDAKTTATNEARGTLSGTTLTWTSDVAARTDGTLDCDGSLCGKFGAPPSGTSALHVPTHEAHFNPWIFSPDMTTFTMAKAWQSHSESPKQTAFVALSGREIRRTCAGR